MTPGRRRALEAIRDNPGVYAGRQLAAILWPDSKGWTTRSRRHATPAGGAMATGIVMRAGSLVTDLENRGLVAVHYAGGGRRQVYLTGTGRAALEE